MPDQDPFVLHELVTADQPTSGDDRYFLEALS